MDPRLRTVIVPKVLEKARRKSVETKKNRDKSSICDSYVSMYVVPYERLAYIGHFFFPTAQMYIMITVTCEGASDRDTGGKLQSSSYN